MTEARTYPSGVPCWLDIEPADRDAARHFYGSLFGWEFTDYGPDYAGIKSGSGEMGGMRSDVAVRPGGPLVILYSHDLAASVAAVEAAGGTITTAPFEFPGGRRFHFADPSGNELAVWSER